MKHSSGSAETLAAQGAAFAACGRTAEAESALSNLRDRAEHGYVSPVLLAQVLVALGRHDEALAMLERAVELKATDLIWLGVRPSWDPLTSSRRFEAILASTGLFLG